MGAFLSAFDDRTRPAPAFAKFLVASGVAGEIVVTHGPDHTTAEAASTLGLPDDSRVLKSLVFMVGDSALLVIARGCDRISLPLLEHHCGASPARLASPAEAEATTGFAPGCIPPLLMPGMPRIPVLMDKQVLLSHAPVYAGAGAHGDHLKIAPCELRRASGAIVARLVDALPPQDTTAQGDERDPMVAAPQAKQPVAAPLLPVVGSPAPPAEASPRGSAAPLPIPAPETPSRPADGEAIAGIASRPSPPAERHYVLSGTQYVEVMTADSHGGSAGVLVGVGGLPDAPVGVSGYTDEPHYADEPHKKVSAAVWTHLADTAISHDEEVEQLEVVRVRRQGRLLAFASVRELGYNTDRDPAEIGTALDSGCSAGDVPKRRPPIGQLIAGRMFSTQVGAEHAAAVLRQVKAGSVVTVRGRVQRNPREADCNTPTTADMVARCLEIRSQPSRPPANRAEARRDGLAGADVVVASKPRPKSKSAAFSSGAPLSSTDTLALPTAQCVDDHKRLLAFCATVDWWCGTSATIGLDCEWRPRRLDAQDAHDAHDAQDETRVAAALPVAVLQLASAEEAFVIDILTLLRTCGGEAMATLSGAVGKLFRCAASTKLGFASKGDTDRLEAALPGCTDAIASLIDVQPLVSEALGLKRKATPGLRHACAALLAVELSKDQQTSDWEARPFTAAQLTYAATDASVLLPLFQAARSRLEQCVV